MQRLPFSPRPRCVLRAALTGLAVSWLVACGGPAEAPEGEDRSGDEDSDAGEPTDTEADSDADSPSTDRDSPGATGDDDTDMTNGAGGGASANPLPSGDDGDGVAETDPDGPGATPSTAFDCDSSLGDPEAVLRRLTMTQYSNTLRDLVLWATGGAGDAQTLVDAALSSLPTNHREVVPEDLHGSYQRLDQTLQQTHVDSVYATSLDVSALLTGDELFETVVGSCATDTDPDNDLSCRDDFIRRFGERTLRKPLDDETVAFYASIYGADATADPRAYADVITVMLNAPEALYFVEHGAVEVPDQAGVYEISEYELASRLSYQLWDTAPDDELYQAAADGSLLTEEGYAAQVDRLLNDERARTTLRSFFEDWMKVEDLPSLDANNGDPVFAAFAGDDLPDGTIRERAMIMSSRPVSWNYSNPSTQSGSIENVRGVESSLDLFDRIFVPDEERTPERPLVVDRILESYQRLRSSNRRLSGSTGSAWTTTSTASPSWSANSRPRHRAKAWYPRRKTLATSATTIPRRRRGTANSSTTSSSPRSLAARAASPYPAMARRKSSFRTPATGTKTWRTSGRPRRRRPSWSTPTSASSKGT